MRQSGMIRYLDPGQDLRSSAYSTRLRWCIGRLASQCPCNRRYRNSGILPRCTASRRNLRHPLHWAYSTRLHWRTGRLRFRYFCNRPYRNSELRLPYTGDRRNRRRRPYSTRSKYCFHSSLCKRRPAGCRTGPREDIFRRDCCIGKRKPASYSNDMSYWDQQKRYTSRTVGATLLQRECFQHRCPDSTACKTPHQWPKHDWKRPRSRPQPPKAYRAARRPP
jgi:hypothetical protein